MGMLGFAWEYNKKLGLGPWSTSEEATNLIYSRQNYRRAIKNVWDSKTYLN